MSSKAEQDLKLLPDGALEQGAKLLNVDVLKIETVAEVEAGIAGMFDAAGNPTRLHECHVAYRYAKSIGIDPEWIRRTYPHVADLIRENRYTGKEYGSYAAQVRKYNLIASLPFDKAEEIAIAASSWGLWQTLGEGWKEMGYATAQEFARSMSTPSGQFEAFMRYIKWRKLDDELRENRWEDFARIYNGPAYKENNYDWKLSTTYLRKLAKNSPNKPITKSITTRSIVIAGTAVAAIEPLKPVNINTSCSACASTDSSSTPQPFVMPWTYSVSQALILIGVFILILYRKRNYL